MTLGKRLESYGLSTLGTVVGEETAVKNKPPMKKSLIALAQIVATQSAAQLVLLGLGNSALEASLAVSFLSVVAPLYSSKVARTYKQAFSTFMSSTETLAPKR